MKKIGILTIAASLLIGFASSCMRSKTDSIPPDAARNEMSFKVGVKNLGGDTTKAVIPAEEGEDMIHSLCLVFFEKSDYSTGLYKAHYFLPSGSLSMSAEIDFSTSIPGILANEAYNILVFANIPDDTYFHDSVEAWLESMDKMTEMQFMDNAYLTIYGAEDNLISDNSAAIPQNMLPMSTRVTKEANQTSVDIMLERDIVRFDVINNMSATYDLVSASVWNAPTIGSMWDDSVTPDTGYTERLPLYGYRRKT